MNYQAYKGRIIRPNVVTRVYRNLHNGLLSVQQGGLVVAHVDTIDLEHTCFVVNEAGRQRVLTERKKNVHAFIEGYVLAVNEDTPLSVQQANRRVGYNPYKCGEFTVQTKQGVFVKANVLPYEKLHCSALLGLFITNKVGE